MHFEILVEDQSGQAALEVLVPAIVGDRHTYKVISLGGLGVIPRKGSSFSAAKKTLFSHLGQVLRAYGKSWQNYHAAVFVVCDLDDKCLRVFRNQLLEILDSCDPSPETRFCFAIEEGEAWFLGDIPAIKAAYPKAKYSALSGYKNDSICGTWEKLADVIYSGRSAALKKKGYPEIGIEKSRWAEKISPKMDINNNRSQSFVYFRDKLRELASA